MDAIDPKDHLGLVYLYANKFAHGKDPDDLVSAGFIGLMKAARKFDPARGVLFSTYASWWIFAEITREHQMNCLVRGPLRTKVRTASLDQVRIEDGKTLHDILPDPQPDVEDRAIVLERCAAVRRAISKITSQRARQIVHAKYFAGKTLAEIGREIGLSRERVRQILGEAQTHLKKELKHHDDLH